MIKEQLIKWMPEYYTGENVSSIQSARDSQLAAYEADQQRVVGDMYVSSATDIDKWEEEYGVTASSSATLTQRRQNMLAIIRGGGGAVTKAQIITLINSYTGTDDTEVTEYPDESLIRITCHLLPDSIFNLDDMVSMLYGLIQGHVGVIIDAIWNYEAESAVYVGVANRGSYLRLPTIIT